MTDISKEAVERCYFVIKRGLYYGPNNRGYTDRPILAGLYTKEEAEEMTHPNGVSGPRDGMHYKHVDDVGDADWVMFRALSARIEELEAALRDVRHEICKGPVHDVLWHQSIPAETTVDFICNTLGDDWDYDEWLAQNSALMEEPQ